MSLTLAMMITILIMIYDWMKRLCGGIRYGRHKVGLLLSLYFPTFANKKPKPMTESDKEIINLLAKRMAGVMRVALTDVIESRSPSLYGCYYVKLKGDAEEPITPVGRWLALRAYAKAIWLVAIIVFPFATKHTIIANMNDD